MYWAETLPAFVTCEVKLRGTWCLPAANARLDDRNFVDEPVQNDAKHNTGLLRLHSANSDVHAK